MKIIRTSEIKGDNRPDGRTVKTLLESPEMNLYLCQVPGSKFGSHYHSGSTEIIVFPQGGAITINGEDFVMEPWDMAVMDKGDIHGFSGNSNDIIHFAVKIPGVDDKVDA